MAQIVDCMANKCKYWNNYQCTNKEGIKLDGRAKCKNFQLHEKFKHISGKENEDAD